jgi:hypothetical protein
LSSSGLNRIHRRLPPAEKVHTLVGTATATEILEDRFEVQLLSVSLSALNPTNNPVQVSIPGGLSAWVGAKAVLNRDVYFGAIGPTLPKIELVLPNNEPVDYTIVYAPREAGV